MSEKIQITENASDATQGNKWYIVNTMHGQEKRVASDILMRAKAYALDQDIHNTFVPERTINIIHDGKRKQRLEPIHPGYVYIHMRLTDKTWYVVRNTPGVTGFVGTRRIPVAVPDHEMERIFKFIADAAKPQFGVGDRVKFIDGPLMFQEGIVTRIDEQQRRAQLQVNGMLVEADLDSLEARRNDT